MDTPRGSAGIVVTCVGEADAKGANEAARDTAAIATAAASFMGSSRVEPGDFGRVRRPFPRAASRPLRKARPAETIAFGGRETDGRRPSPSGNGPMSHRVGALTDACVSAYGG